MDDFDVPYIETPKELPTEREASDHAFYTAAASDGDPISDFHQVKNDLMTSGESDLMEDRKKAWHLEQDQGQRAAIENIMGDTTLSPAVKKSVLQTYQLTGTTPSGLRDRYIQKTAAEDHYNNTVQDQKHQDWIVANIENRRKQLDVTRRKYDIDSNLTRMQSLLAGAQHIYKGVENTTGIISDEEYKAGYKEYKKHADTNPISTGVGSALGLISGAVGGFIVGGPAGAILVTGAAGGASRFAELGAEDVAVSPEDRLSAAMASAGMTSAEVALPIFRTATLVKAMLMNGMGNVAMGELDVSIQNQILSAYPELQGEQFDAKNMTVNAVFGALLGAAFGRVPKGRQQGASPTREQETPAEATPDTSSPVGLLEDNSNTVRFPETMVGGPDGSMGTATQRASAEAKMSPEERVAARTASLDLERSRPLASVSGETPVAKLIPPGSPMDTTKMANPAVATKAAINAIQDPSGRLADAMGTNRGSLINDWGLPKVFEGDIKDVNPYILNTLEDLDAGAKELFSDRRYDPNIVSATKRLEDDAKLYSVVKSVRKGVYQQSNSIVDFTSQGMSQGKMTFGQSESTAFVTEADAVHLQKELQDIVDQMPEGEQGVVSIVNKGSDGYQVQWDWKKEYDDFAMQAFGIQSAQTNILGFKADALARSALGNFIFSHGRFDRGIEQGAIRGPERTAFAESFFIDAINKHINKTKFGTELNRLISEAEEGGIESFSKRDMGQMFPYLKQNELDQLQEGHTVWRRVNHYLHQFANREMRKTLTDLEMEGIYNTSTGEYMGPGTMKISQKEMDDIGTVWDFETESAVDFKNPSVLNGKRLVRLHEKINEPGKVHNYALVGGSTELNMLPTQVLNRIPGYSPRVVKENHFVESVPTKLIIDGKLVTDSSILRGYGRTVAASKNKWEATKLEEQERANNPENYVYTRPEKQESLGKVITDYQVHSEMYAQSKKRGERLPSLNGSARIEDRMISLIKAIRSTAQTGAMRDWDQQFKTAYSNSFRQYFKKGEYPTSKNDLEGKEKMSHEEAKDFKVAQRLFEFHAKMTQFETYSDHIWRVGLSSLADVLDSAKLPHEFVRDTAKKGAVPVKASKAATTAVLLHMNPVRQWIIQPAQLMEMYLANPKNGLSMFRDMMAMRLSVASDGLHQDGVGDFIKHISRNANGMGPEEFELTRDALLKSGLLQGVDTNVLVHGLFKEVDRNLVETKATEIGRDLESAAKAIPRAGRVIGFDLAETTNRIGLYLQAKQLWIDQHPGQDWNTPENRETIAAEGQMLSGVMNEAASLPYQRGVMSIFMQFAAINQKLLMNLLQNTATSMTAKQRAAIAATRFVLYGSVGIPGGKYLFDLIDEYFGEGNEAEIDVVRRGLSDYVANNLVAATVEPDVPADIAIGKSLSPYSENFLPYFDFTLELFKLVNSNPADNPRFPGLALAGTLGKTAEQINSWFTAKEVNEESAKQIFLEVAEIMPGFNNYLKGMAMLGIDDVVTANGNSLGFQYAKAEALARMVGFQSHKDINLWEVNLLASEHKAQMRDAAKSIHQNLENQSRKLGGLEQEDYSNRLRSLITVLPERFFSEDDRLQLIDDVFALDRKSQKDINTSVLSNVVKFHTDQSTETNKKMLDIMRKQKDPRTQVIREAIENGEL